MCVGVLRWQGHKYLPPEEWAEVLALSRKGSLMPQSDCGGVSNTDKAFVVSEWVSLETLGFGSTRGGMQAGVSGLLWPLWVCGLGTCADVHCMK